MSSSVPPTQPPPSVPTLSQASVLGPGLVDILIQGIETGLVFAQFSRWFSRPDRGGSIVLSTVVIFVTVVGLAQSGLCFASAWSKYVQRFGMALRPDWEDLVQSIPTYVISFPVQGLMIVRCYWLGGKNMFIIMPLVLLLVASMAMASWSVYLLIHYLTTFPEEDWVRLPQTVGVLWPYTISLLLPSVLDLALTGILLYYLTRAMKRVYSPHKRKSVTRLVNVVWQSALPPTLCAICTLVLYLLFTTASQMAVQFWFPVVQAMIGKLYILSLFYMMCVLRYRLRLDILHHL
ncbi:hypothetical protein EDB92DRAFT_1966600 [Lactarius akahatsu]|uniref:DUF6534 domain-containing protein n=1 Tax=Lactarius akahatsu TaxID=416441 RepID=A0AAD4LSJ9_9AGAM|nr:hypothetical protein EDB92DRAFT_1966600 [Lactarius akahatsu]